MDKLAAAGFGSTVNSCAIVRFTYSTYTGVAMAYEGLQYWLEWPAYVEAPDELGLIEYKQCSMATLKDPGGRYLKVLPHFDAVGVAYEEWSTDELIEAVESGHDHDTDPLVVNGRYTGLPIDMGTYSRNRQVNLNSSMSVHG